MRRRWVVLKIAPREDVPAGENVSVINREVFLDPVSAEKRAQVQQSWDDKHNGGQSTMYVVEVDPPARNNVDRAVAAMREHVETLQATSDRLLNEVIDRHPDKDPDAAMRYASYASATRSMLDLFLKEMAK